MNNLFFLLFSKLRLYKDQSKHSAFISKTVYLNSSPVGRGPKRQSHVAREDRNRHGAVLSTVTEEIAAFKKAHFNFGRQWRLGCGRAWRPPIYFITYKKFLRALFSLNVSVPDLPRIGLNLPGWKPSQIDVGVFMQILRNWENLG